MSKEFDSGLAKTLAALLKAADENGIKTTVTITRRSEEVLNFRIPDFVKNSKDFNRTLIDLELLPSRIFSNNKTNRNVKKNSRAYIVYITNNNIDKLSTVELKKLLNSLDQDSKNISDVAPFIWNVFRTWNNLHKNLRTHHSLSEDMVRGYLKQRQTYSHREILDMVETYGKWAKAYFDMVEANEFKPCWFPSTNLKNLLLSNKLFPNHLEGGWKQLVRDKQIPDDYAGVEQESSYAKLKKEKSPEEEHNKRILYWAHQSIDYGENVIQQDILEQYGDEIRAKVKELQNAA